MRGTYFIGYARHWDVTRKLVTNMFTQDDCLLEYLAAEKKAVFLHPIEGTLGTHRRKRIVLGALNILVFS